MLMSNPFTPGFGQAPPLLATQGSPVEDFEAALRGHSPAGERSVLISGARGTGKTVLLMQFREVARENGWLGIAVRTGAPSMMDELRGEVASELRKADPEAVSSRWTSAGVGVLGASAQARRQVSERYDTEVEPTGRLLDRLANLCDGRGRGVMIGIDEVQSADTHQLHDLTQLVQDMIGRGHRIAFVAAGIRSGVDELLDHQRTTFLRRSHQLSTGSVDVGTAAEVIQQTVAATDKSITPEAAARAGEISQGYPYLIQVVGAKAWQHSGDEPTIAVEDVEAVRSGVIGQMIRDVHQPVLRDLSPTKVDYLVAMLDDEGRPSATSDVAERMGKDMKYQSVYRERLIRDEVIRPAEHGAVEFAMPYMREAVVERLTGQRRHASTPSASISPRRRATPG